MKKLMKGFVLAGLLLAVGLTTTTAQEITDTDLKNYAIIELAKNSIVNEISPMVNDLISKQEGMTGQRFQELQGAKGNQAKLTEMEAQDWEIKFLELVNHQIEKKKKAAGEVVKILAGNLGADKYNAIKSKVSSDAETKSKLDALLAKFE